MISSGHNSSNLVWLRLDLRLTYNPALAAAVERIISHAVAREVALEAFARMKFPSA